MFFDTSSPIIFSLTILAIIAAFLSLVKGWRARQFQLSLALLISLVSCRMIEINYGMANVQYHTYAMVLCSLICIVGAKGCKPYLLDVERYSVYYTVSVLYCIRIISLKLLAPVTGLVIANDISLLLLFIQLLLVIGDVYGGRKFSGRVYNYGVAAYDRIVSVGRT